MKDSSKSTRRILLIAGVTVVVLLGCCVAALRPVSKHRPDPVESPTPTPTG